MVYDCRKVRVGPAVIPTVERARKVLFDLAAEGKPVYGLNHGAGWNKDREFSITPMKDTTALYCEIMDEWNVSAGRVEAKSGGQVVGKSAVLRLLSLCNGTRVREGRPCAMVWGEAGVGKTYLVDFLLREYDFSDRIVLRASCYPSELASAMGPWHTVMLQPISASTHLGIQLPESCRKTASGLFPCLAPERAEARV